MPGNGKAPVERVGGNQDAGPWDPDVEEVEVGGRYRRKVQLPDQAAAEVEVTVTQLEERDDGTRVVVSTFGGES